MTYGDVVRWEQDASVVRYHRANLANCPTVSTSSTPDALEVYFPVTVKADAMPDRTGTVVITFPPG